jgi:hypothetical protein
MIRTPLVSIAYHYKHSDWLSHSIISVSNIGKQYSNLYNKGLIITRDFCITKGNSNTNAKAVCNCLTIYKRIKVLKNEYEKRHHCIDRSRSIGNGYR